MIKPHIIIDPIHVSVIMPFNLEAKEELKGRIPYEQRTWDPDGKAWRLSATEENYKIALEIIRSHFHMNPPVFSKGGDPQAAFNVAINTTSYYTTLQVKDDATVEEIKKGHRKLVKKVHPDYGGDPEHFRKIQLAYETLSNPKKKKRYDLARRLVYKKAISQDVDDSIYSFYPHAQGGITSSIRQTVYAQPVSYASQFSVGDFVSWSLGSFNSIYKITYINMVTDSANLIEVDTFGDPISSLVLAANCVILTPTTLNPQVFRQGEILKWGTRIVKFCAVSSPNIASVKVFPFLGPSQLIKHSELRFYSSPPFTLERFALMLDQGDLVNIKSMPHLSPAVFIKKIGDTDQAMIDTPAGILGSRTWTPGRRSNLGTTFIDDLEYYVPTK